MYKFLACLLLFIFFASTLYAQQPTDYPKPETREVPERLQDPLTMWLFIIGVAAVIFAFIYFIRFDKILSRWWYRRRLRR